MALRHLPPQSDMQEPAVVPHGGFLFRVPLGEGKPIGRIRAAVDALARVGAVVEHDDAVSSVGRTGMVGAASRCCRRNAGPNACPSPTKASSEAALRRASPGPRETKRALRPQPKRRRG